MRLMRTLGSARWVRVTAGFVLLAGAGGTGFVLGQDDDSGPESVSAARTTTVERPTTRSRPTTTTRPAPTTTTWWTCTDLLSEAECDTSLDDLEALETTTTAPPVIVYEAPPTVTAPPETWCDAACTEALICGWGGCADTTEQTPCRPSTINSCDPSEPIELPTIGCDYLERDLMGNVRCAD